MGGAPQHCGAPSSLHPPEGRQAPPLADQFGLGGRPPTNATAGGRDRSARRVRFVNRPDIFREPRSRSGGLPLVRVSAWRRVAGSVDRRGFTVERADGRKGKGRRAGQPDAHGDCGANRRDAGDLVRRNVFVAVPSRLWVADISFIPTMAGFLVLAAVPDAWSRGVRRLAILQQPQDKGASSMPARPSGPAGVMMSSTTRTRGSAIQVAGVRQPLHWRCRSRGRVRSLA
jgi:hypothetical protein